MTLFRKSISKIVKLWRDREIEKKVEGIRDFEQNMCGKAGFENPIMDPHSTYIRGFSLTN